MINEEYAEREYSHARHVAFRNLSEALYHFDSDALAKLLQFLLEDAFREHSPLMEALGDGDFWRIST